LGKGFIREGIEGMSFPGWDERRGTEEYPRSYHVIFRGGKREGEKKSGRAIKKHRCRDDSMTEKRLLPVSGKQMVKVFIKVGFQIDRQRGSHIVMSKGEIILVIPGHETVAKGTERALIRDAGLTVEEFNKLLQK
jgi:predicted RNA binding protein YcfA (HicA-like mRNA interferase family)